MSETEDRLCTNCRESEVFVDDHCIDCWPGYDSCDTKGCNHYRCEHSFGEISEIVYDRDNPENVGQKVQFREGCMNAGCKCRKWLEPSPTRAERNRR